MDITPDEIRTRNPQIRSLVRYPIAPQGHYTYLPVIVYYYKKFQIFKKEFLTTGIEPVT